MRLNRQNKRKIIEDGETRWLVCPTILYPMITVGQVFLEMRKRNPETLFQIIVMWFGILLHLMVHFCSLLLQNLKSSGKTWCSVLFYSSGDLFSLYLLECRTGKRCSLEQMRKAYLGKTKSQVPPELFSLLFVICPQQILLCCMLWIPFAMTGGRRVTSICHHQHHPDPLEQKAAGRQAWDFVTRKE